MRPDFGFDVPIFHVNVRNCDLDHVAM